MLAIRLPYLDLHRLPYIVTALTCLASSYGSARPTVYAAVSPAAPQPFGVAAPVAPLALSGFAFRDLDFDGGRDVGETGVADVTVTAFDLSGAAVGAATTAADGTYVLAPAGTGPYRIEFSGWPSFLQPGPRGPDSGTTVQFAATANVGALNLGLANPADFVGGANPRLATTVYAAGPIIGSQGGLVSWPYTANTDTFAGLITHTGSVNIGSTYGLAYKPSSQDFFTSAFVKRGVELGAGGAGAIYKVAANGLVTVLVDLGSAAGGFTRTRDFTPSPPSFDEDATALVGKAGLGDLDLSEDETSLWTINLADRSLYKIDIAAAEVGTGNVGAILIGPPPNPGCVNDTSGGRPFGLKIKDGVIYVGGVCTGQDGPALGSTDDIEAYVYTYTESAGWGPAPVLQFKLDYPTTCADVYPLYAPNKLCRPGVIGSNAAWYSWFDGLPLRTAFFDTDYTFNSETTDGFVVSPQPQLTDIEFSGNDMIVALRDRFADQLGWNDPGPFGVSPFAPFNMSAVPMGDLLRASPIITTATTPSAVIGWALEQNTTGSTFGPTVGADTGAGPCLDPLITTTQCGEFFVDNFNPTPSTGHDETTMGSVAQVPGYPEVAVTAYDPFSLETAGVIQLSNATGTRVRGYEVARGGSLIQTGGPINKANGLGDLEFMTDPAPLEIGNRVWLDANSNGVQDAPEAGIAGVRVSVYRPGVGADCVAGTADDAAVIATAQTSATGQYYFKTGTGVDALPDDETGLVDGSVCALQTSATYSVRLDNAADYTTAGPLDLLLLTERDDAVITPNGADSNDSDGAYVGPFAVITHTVPISGIGSSNHTLDFGFAQQVLVTPAVSLGNQVWFDIDNDTVIDASEVGVAGAAVQLFYDADGNGAVDVSEQTPVAAQTTTAQGFYLFTQTVTGTALAPGNYAVCVAPGNFVAGGPLLGYFSSGTTLSGTTVLSEAVPALPNGDVDNDDNGLATMSGLCANGALSGLISVTGNEPLTEVPGNSAGTPPGTTPGLIDVVDTISSNLTLDFGFVLPVTTPVVPPPVTPTITPAVSLGNQVWFDTDNDAVIDASEVGVGGAAMQLFYDADGNGAVDVSEQTPVATQTTTAQGFYLFTQTVTGMVLVPGSYAVCVAPGNFVAGGPLLGYFSSGTTLSETAALSETVPATPNGDVDNDDNGLGTTNSLCTNGALSGLVSVTGNEPLTEVPSNATSTPPGTTPGLIDVADTLSSNLTLDFGFVLPVTTPVVPPVTPTITPAVSLGNQVWFDTDNDAVIDATEVGVSGAAVQLFYDANGNGAVDVSEQAPVVTQTTTAQGFYLFTQTVTGTVLTPGNYAVCIVAGNFVAGGPLVGHYSSGTTLSGTAALSETVPATPNGDVDNDDSGLSIGTGVCANGALSGLISVTGNEPLTEVPGNATSTPAGTTPGLIDVTGNISSNLTLDFGFVLPVTQPVTTPITSGINLGNQVWFDTDNDSAVDVNEVGVAGVTLQLFYDTNGNARLDLVEQTPVATQTTTAQGFYLFTQTVTSTTLTPGNYAVCVAAGNFGSGRVLNGYLSSGTRMTASGVLTETDSANADADIDNDDGGRRGSDLAVCMDRLISVTGNEPVNEVPGNITSTVPGTTPGLATSVVNTASNATLDFGFYQVGLGNIVWLDIDDSGKADATERGLNEVRVKLYAETGATEILVGADGCLGTADDAAGGTRTREAAGQGSGRYGFCGLPEGTYRVCIVQPLGYTSSTGGSTNLYEPGPDPDGEGSTPQNTDSDDNGTAAPGGICADGIESKAVTLTPGRVPNVDNAVDLAAGKTTNPTVDFGLTVRSPNAVALTRLDVMREVYGVRIVWHTGAELNTFGFAVYRSEGDDRTQAVLVTSELVAALGTGSVYEVLDTSADLAKPYHYWLKEYEQADTPDSTRQHWHGPMVVAASVIGPVATVALGASPVGGGVAMEPAFATPAPANAVDPSVVQLAQAEQLAQSIQPVQIEPVETAVPKPPAASMAVAVSLDESHATRSSEAVKTMGAVADSVAGMPTPVADSLAQLVDVPPPAQAAAVVRAKGRAPEPSWAEGRKPDAQDEGAPVAPADARAGRMLAVALGMLFSIIIVLGGVVWRRRRRG